MGQDFFGHWPSYTSHARARLMVVALETGHDAFLLLLLESKRIAITLPSLKRILQRPTLRARLRFEHLDPLRTMYNMASVLTPLDDAVLAFLVDLLPPFERFKATQFRDFRNLLGPRRCAAFVEDRLFCQHVLDGCMATARSQALILKCLALGANIYGCKQTLFRGMAVIDEEELLSKAEEKERNAAKPNEQQQPQHAIVAPKTDSELSSDDFVCLLLDKGWNQFLYDACQLIKTHRLFKLIVPYLEIPQPNVRSLNVGIRWTQCMFITDFLSVAEVEGLLDYLAATSPQFFRVLLEEGDLRRVLITAVETVPVEKLMSLGLPTLHYLHRSYTLKPQRNLLRNIWARNVIYGCYRTDASKLLDGFLAVAKFFYEHCQAPITDLIGGYGFERLFVLYSFSILGMNRSSAT
jgi:hypothetical protein